MDMKEKASIIALDPYYSLKEEEIVVSAEETWACFSATALCPLWKSKSKKHTRDGEKLT